MKNVFRLFFAVFMIIGPVVCLRAASEGAVDFNINLAQNSPAQAGAINIKLPDPSNDKEMSTAVKAFIILTVLSLAPAIFVLCTSFIRIIIVLSILRQGIGLQQLPPNQILVGFAIFLTIFTMLPVFKEINNTAIAQYNAKQISFEQAVVKGSEPLKKFMLAQTRDNDLGLFLKMSKSPRPASRKDVNIFIAIPAFVLSELKTGFEIGFIIYIPFIVIDMIVASILMSMGMMMLPPVTISLPFKILVFVLIDGWALIAEALLKSFN